MAQHSLVDDCDALMDDDQTKKGPSKTKPAAAPKRLRKSGHQYKLAAREKEAGR